MLSAAAHGRSPEWAEGQRLACVGARGRPLRLGLRCLSLQFTSPSARFGVATFISGSKVLHTLAPWWLALNGFQKNFGKKSPFFFGEREMGSKVLHTLAPCGDGRFGALLEEAAKFLF